MKWGFWGRMGDRDGLKPFWAISNIGCGRSKPSRRWWKEFVSLSKQVDTSTPTGKMVFTVLGAVAELERSLIAERVRAGLRNARAKGKRLGRPKVDVDAARIAHLRRTGASWAEISAQLGIGRGTAYRALHSLPKNRPKKICLTKSARSDYSGNFMRRRRD